MRQLIVIITITLALSFTLSASAQMNNQEKANLDKNAAENAQRLKQARAKHASTYKEVNVDLDMLAKGMAESLSDPHFRNFLRKEIKNSRKKENILRMHNFIDKATKVKDMPTKAKAPKRLQDVKAVRQKLKNRKYLQLFGNNNIDIYFPVPEHRNKWKGNDDLLVAFSPTQDESEVTQIVAYSAKNGKRVILDSKRIPVTPVLVVTVSEHETLEPEPEKAPPPTEPVPSSNPPKGPEPVPGSVGKYKGGNSYAALKYLKITNDHEPWYKGDPEIYAVLLQWRGNDKRKEKRDLARVNDENKWYWVQDIASWYFDSNYADGTLMVIWERDGTSWVSDLFAGVASSVIGVFNPGLGAAVSYAYMVYSVADGDDFVGQREFSKSWIPWGGTIYRYLYSGGYMYTYKSH